MLKALWPVVNQFQNKNGSILTAGKVYVYYKNRTALAEIFSDEEGTVVNANPVLLDNNGRATVFADTIYSYTIVVCDYYGKELFSQDITLHDVTETADEITLIGSDGSIHIDTSSSSNGVKTFDMSANTDILATKKSVDDLDIRVKKNEDDIKVISGNVENIASEMSGKKDKQSELTFNGYATKTVKSITQNANGELNVEFADIDLPQEVPNVEITSEDNSVKVTETTDVQTNTKKFDLSVQGGGTTYSAGDAIDLTNNTISTKYGKGLEITTDNKLQLKVGEGLTLDNDTLELTIKDLATSITSFRTGDVIPVDGPSGTAKMSKDDLLKEAAVSVAASGLLPKFDITDKLNLSVFGEHRIKVEDSVATDNNFAAKNVNGNISVGYSTGSDTRIVYWDISALPEGDYEFEADYSNSNATNVYLTVSETYNGSNDGGFTFLASTTGTIRASFKKTSTRKFIRFYSVDFQQGSTLTLSRFCFVSVKSLKSRTTSLEEETGAISETIGMNFQEFDTLENTDRSGTKVTIDGRTLSVERLSARRTAYISMALESKLEVNKVYTLELEYVNEVANNVWLSTSETRTGDSVKGYTQKLLPNTAGKIVFDYLVTSQTKYIRFVSGDFNPVGSKFRVTNIRWVEKEGLSGSVKTIETSMVPAGLTSVRKNNGQFIALDGTGIFLRKNGNLLMAWDGKDAALNPVIPVSCPDPTFIKKGEYFYAFGTGRPCQIFRSTDMVNWELYSQIFPDDFDYKATFGSEFRNCWACDANIIGGKIVVYVAIHTTSEYTEKTIAMEANDITNPTSFVYKGVVVPGTADGGMRNAIDPDYFNDNGVQYIICGSYYGIYIFEMTDYLTADLSSKQQIVNSGTNEGAYVFKHGGYYYLFTSSGDYANYTYKVGISRATSITGPYLNKDGEDVVNHQPTTILYSDEGDEMYGPGHNGEIYTDNDGDMYMLLHCHVYGLLTPEASRPAILMRIVEGQDGWLAFADKDGNVVTKLTPITSVPKV